VALAAANENAFLLASKELLSIPAVEREMVIKYTIYNAGSGFVFVAIYWG